MRILQSCLLAALLLPAGSRAAGVAWMELDSYLPADDADSGSLPAVQWSLGYPDTLARTDTRAILASIAPGKGPTLLPQGRLAPEEIAFVVGLRAFMDGNAARAAEAWATLRGRKLSPELGAALRVNGGVLRALRGDPSGAETAWRAEWRSARASARPPGAEGAWRNLLALYMGQGRWREADTHVEEMLAAAPRHRLALLAKAALLWRFRPEAEWAGFLRARAEEDSAAPEMQLAYADYLLDRDRLAEAVIFFDKGLAQKSGAGRAWYRLAEAQFRQGYLYFALDCLQNAGRAGYQEADFHELYARVLHACCTGDEDPRAPAARAAAQELLEKGLVKDLHRRSAAQLLRTLYAQNLKPGAARDIERNLWFHFEGPRRDVPPLGDPAWADAGIDARALRIKFGLYDWTWMRALRATDVFRGL